MASRATKPKANGGTLAVEKVREEVPAKTPKKLRFENVGPNASFEDLFQPGLNYLCGGNGAGKSTLCDMITAAGGTDVPVSVKDGASAARLIYDDGAVFEVNRKKGEPPNVSLVSVDTAALVVDPGIKDRTSAEEARLKHVMKLVRAQTTDAMIEFFLAAAVQKEGESPEVDAEVYDYVDAKVGIERLKEMDPVAVVDVLIKGKAGQVHTLKREYLQKATDAAARYQVANPQKPERLSGVSLLDADREYQNAIGDYRQVQGEASQRAQLERQKAEIEATLGDRPDVVGAHARTEGAQADYDLVAAEIMELEKQLSAARARAISAKVTLDQSKKYATDTVQAAVSWDRRKEILDTPITGATPSEVLTAENRVIVSKASLELARSTEEYRKKLEVAQAAAKERDEATRRAGEIERLAEHIPGRLAEQFNLLGIPGARVTEGVLEVLNEQGEWEPFYRRSKGQKWGWVLPIRAAHNPGVYLALPKEVHSELEREREQEAHQVFLANSIIAIAEVTTFEGDKLHVEWFKPAA